MVPAGLSAAVPGSPPDKSMQKVVWSEQSFSGPSKFEDLLPRAKKDVKLNDYRDIAVLAIPEQTNVAVSAIMDLTTHMNSIGKVTRDAPAGYPGMAGGCLGYLRERMHGPIL